MNLKPGTVVEGRDPKTGKKPFVTKRSPDLSKVEIAILRILQAQYGVPLDPRRMETMLVEAGLSESEAGRFVEARRRLQHLGLVHNSSVGAGVGWGGVKTVEIRWPGDDVITEAGMKALKGFNGPTAKRKSR